MIFSFAVSFESKTKKIPDLSLPPCIATASQSHPLHRPGIGRFHCWWRFSVFTLLLSTYLQLKNAYNCLLASGLQFMPTNTFPKYRYPLRWLGIFQQQPSEWSFDIQILKIAQFWRDVAFLFASTVYLRRWRWKAWQPIRQVRPPLPAMRSGSWSRNAGFESKQKKR